MKFISLDDDEYVPHLNGSLDATMTAMLLGMRMLSKASLASIIFLLLSVASSENIEIII